MGVVAKQTTKRHLVAVTTRVGSWLDDAASVAPWLARADLIGLAVQHAVLDTPTGKAATTTLPPGKYGAAQTAGASRRSALRVEGRPNGADAAINLFAVDGVGREWSDWRLAVSTAGSTATIDLTTYRTREDKIPNSDLLELVKARVADRLENGIRLEVSDGFADLDTLVRPQILNVKSSFSQSESSFAHDRLLTPPQWLVDSTPMQMPAASAEALIDVLRGEGARHDELAAGGDRWAVELGLSGTRLELVRDAGGIALRAVFPQPQSTVGRQRSVRVVLALMRRIAMGLGEDPAAASVRHYVSHATSVWSDENRAATATEVWSDDTPVPVVPLHGMQTWPVAISALGRFDDSATLLMIRASLATVIFERTFTRGLKLETRQANLVHTARRFFVAKSKDGKALPFGRFAHVVDNQPEVVFTLELGAGWWWEVAATKIRTDDGRDRVTLLFRGVSHADAIVAYGVEQLAMMRNFAEHVRSVDPSVELQTLSIGTAGGANPAKQMWAPPTIDSPPAPPLPAPLPPPSPATQATSPEGPP